MFVTDVPIWPEELQSENEERVKEIKEMVTFKIDAPNITYFDNKPVMLLKVILHDRKYRYEDDIENLIQERDIKQIVPILQILKETMQCSDRAVSLARHCFQNVNS